MVQVENLSFAFADRTILYDISCAFGSGRMHGIIGPNGAGKSTLLRTICRIWQPSGGTVRIAGRDHRLLDRRTLSRQITLVPQDTRVEFSIRVRDFVAMGRHPHLQRLQWPGRHDEEVIEKSMQITATSHLRDRPVNELSGGECQLVNIARALATEAPIILLDEPTSALDIRHKLEIMKLLQALRGEGKTVVMNLHDLDLARRYCDTVTMLKSGQIFYHGPAEEAFAREKILDVFDVHVEEGQTPHGASLLFY